MLVHGFEAATPSEVGAVIIPERIVALSSVIDIWSITNSFSGVAHLDLNTNSSTHGRQASINSSR